MRAGADVVIESGLGLGAGHSDEDYATAGAHVSHDRAALLALTGLASMMASAFALRLPLWAWVPAAIAIVAPGIVATRRPSVRRLGVAWLAGFGATVVLLIAVIITNLG